MRLVRTQTVLVLGLAFASLLGCGTVSSATSRHSSAPVRQVSNTTPFVHFSQIQMMNVQDGWATTSLNIYRTVSGGNLWTHVKIPAGRLVASDFVNASIAFLVIENQTNGRYRLWTTLDGGQTWSCSDNLPGNPSTFRQIDFINASNGWAVNVEYIGMEGTHFQIYRTIDGGHDWRKIRSSGSNGYLIGMTFVSEREGWLIGQYKTPGEFFLYSTDDGGSHWKLAAVPLPKESTANPWSPGMPQFFGHDGVWTLGGGDDRTYVYRTNTMGRTWEIGGRFPKLLSPMGVTFSNIQDGWLWSDKQLWSTHDGGRTWKPLYQSGEGEQIQQIDPVTSRIGWMILTDHDHDELYKSMDGGVTWSHIGHL